ncbi:response regulator [Patescibacteria group bacterium]|nr:response regulator [Patescibacteria group bacterium]
MKIIIADDDSFFRNFYSSKLKELGYEVETAADGNETLEKTRSFKPGVLLLDIIMPVKDGFTVLKTLKSDPATSALPVIVFSTLGQEADVDKAKNLGANDYVNKSYFDFPKMLEKIKSFSK